MTARRAATPSWTAGRQPSRADSDKPGTGDEQDGDGSAKPGLNRANRLHIRFHLSHPWNESNSSVRPRMTAQGLPQTRLPLFIGACVRATHCAAAHIGMSDLRLSVFEAENGMTVQPTCWPIRAIG